MLQLEEILNEVDQELDNYRNKDADFSNPYDKPRPPILSEEVTKRPKKLLPFDVKDKETSKPAHDKKPFFTRLFEHPCKC